MTSPKFLAAEGGHRRLVWMPKSLKELLKPDPERLFKSMGCPELFDQIADEGVGSEPRTIKAHLEKNEHPALSMKDMASYIEGVEAETPSPEVSVPEGTPPSSKSAELTPEKILEMIRQTASLGLKDGATGEAAVRNVIAALGSKYLGASFRVDAPKDQASPARATAPQPSFLDVKIPKQKCETPIRTVKLGATKDEGGTRKVTYRIGGSTAMPFHSFEGETPRRPLVAMEVFDAVGEKYPKVLREIFGPLLNDPAAMAQACVEKYGADLISVRLDATHPEKGDRSAAKAVETVKAVLAAVDVPLIVTGHNHFD